MRLTVYDISPGCVIFLSFPPPSLIVGNLTRNFYDWLFSLVIFRAKYNCWVLWNLSRMITVNVAALSVNSYWKCIKLFYREWDLCTTVIDVFCSWSEWQSVAMIVNFSLSFSVCVCVHASLIAEGYVKQLERQRKLPWRFGV